MSQRREELFYCYYRNSDSSWHLYYEVGMPEFRQVELYPSGAYGLFEPTEVALVSLKGRVRLRLKSIERKGIKVHLLKKYEKGS